MARLSSAPSKRYSASHRSSISRVEIEQAFSDDDSDEMVSSTSDKKSVMRRSGRPRAGKVVESESEETGEDEEEEEDEETGEEEGDSVGNDTGVTNDTGDVSIEEESDDELVGRKTANRIVDDEEEENYDMGDVGDMSVDVEEEEKEEVEVDIAMESPSKRSPLATRSFSNNASPNTSNIVSNPSPSQKENVIVKRDGTPECDTNAAAQPTTPNTPSKVPPASMPVPSPMQHANLTMDDGAPDGLPLPRSSEEPDEVKQEEQLSHGIHARSLMQQRATSMQQHVIKTPDEPTQRLTISNLVLTNFKSYAGRQEVGPFHSSFSAVVGPNGSGKSNVIDSLLFVFGFRASKMRQGKLSALIHNSANHPNLTFCSVEVHFQDVIDELDGTTSVVPDSTLIVARKAYSNNTSVYTINGRNSSFTEVTTLLKGRGIDLDHKRFLILQGEVESIAQMKAKAEGDHDDGLLEYLEDIIGTSQYKTPIDEAQVQIDSLNEVCLEKKGRMEIVEKELNGLSSERDEIVGYLRLQNELTHKQSLYFQIHAQKCQKVIAMSEQVMSEIQTQLAAEEERNTANRGEIKTLEDGVKSEESVLKGLKKTQTKLASILASHEKEKVQLEERKKHMEGKAKKLEKAIASAELSLSSSESWIEEYDNENSGNIEQLKAYGEELAEAEELMGEIQRDLGDKTRPFSEKIDLLKQKLDPWKQKIVAKEGEVKSALNKVELEEERLSRAEKAVQDSEASIQGIKLEGRSLEKKVAHSEKEKEHVQNQIELGEQECEHAKGKLADMKQRLDDMRAQYNDAKESQSSLQSRGRVVGALMKLKDSGRLPGIHGRLGDLGTIDSEYDTAVSVACPKLDNIVVDTIQTGQACVEYLRKNNLGTGVFQLMDKIGNRRPKNFNTPEGVPRLIDLVKCEPQFIPVFYAAMGETLVAKDLDQANRIAYSGGRYRVVTLQGQLIARSGTMAGGGHVKRVGLMAITGSERSTAKALSADEMRALENEMESEEKRYGVANTTYHQMVASLRDLKERLPQVEVEISKVALEIEALAQNYKSADRQHKELLVELESVQKGSVLEEARAHVASLEAEVEELKSQCSSIDEEIASLEEKIMETGGLKLRMQKSKVDGLVQKIEIVQGKMKTGNKDRSKAQHNVTKQQRIITESQKELQSFQEECAPFQSKFDALEQKVAECETESEEATKAMYEQEEKVSALRNELQEKQAEISEMRKAEVELKNSLLQHKTKVEEEGVKKAQWVKRLQGLKIHNIGEMCGQPDEPEETSSPLVEYSEDELEGNSVSDLKEEIAGLENSVEGIDIDFAILEEYARRARDYETRRSALNEAVEEREQSSKRLEDLKSKRLSEFMSGFNAISMKLKEMYQMITMGGNAELELVDSLDPFSEGILFSVMPPKKSWRNISNLSGGEKTLSSLALVFALHHYKPTPLYVMDEIDAALDFRNVSIVANYIKERTKNAQFIVISLRNNMFELAQRLVGIFKVNNMTKSVTIKNVEAVEAAAAAAAAAKIPPMTPGRGVPMTPGLHRTPGMVHRTPGHLRGPPPTFGGAGMSVSSTPRVPQTPRVPTKATQAGFVEG
ncbi:Structural maintenance of chromosomes protein 4 [Yarrowia sp. C11]|nr:Structural maintenance of chromosomes protein 4 [Yarrowia sp. C11]